MPTVIVFTGCDADIPYFHRAVVDYTGVEADGAVWAGRGN
jgi:hypothetical protein